MCVVVEKLPHLEINNLSPMITIDYLESCFALSCIQLTVVRIFDKELAGTSLKGLVRSDVKKRSSFG